MISMGMNFVEYNGVSPLFGIWLPVGLFFLLALYGIYAAANERMPSVFRIFYIFRKMLRKKRTTAEVH